MPRPPKPTALLELNGAFKKNPSRGRARADEPRPEDPLGPPPEDWVRRAEHSQKHIELLRAWEEIVGQAAFGVLTSADRDCVEMAARLKYKIRFEKWTSGDAAQLKVYLRSMGLTPEDRARVTGAKKSVETANEWAEAAANRPHRRNEAAVQ
jgi:hypothetical protein